MVWKRDKDKWRTNYRDKYRPQRIHKLPSINLRINKSLLTFLLLLVCISVLGYFNYTTGNYVKVLEQNKTYLESRLVNFTEERQKLISDLNTCNNDLLTKISSLEGCQEAKDSTISSLNTCRSDLTGCERDLDNIDSNYYECLDDLDNWERQVNKLRDDIDNLENDLDECEDDLGRCQDDLSGCLSQ